MTNQYDLDEIQVLAEQKQLKRVLKKGDFTPVDQSDLRFTKELLTTNGISFSSLKHAFNIWEIIYQ